MKNASRADTQSLQPVAFHRGSRSTERRTGSSLARTGCRNRLDRVDEQSGRFVVANSIAEGQLLIEAVCIEVQARAALAVQLEQGVTVMVLTGTYLAGR